MNYEDIEVGQKLVAKQSTSGMKAKGGDVVIVSAKGGLGPRCRYVYVEGNGIYSGRGQCAYNFDPFVTPALDLTKPLETMDGRAVAVVTATGREAEYPVLAYIGDEDYVRSYTVTGHYIVGDSHCELNLRNVPVKPLTAELSGYVNIFKRPSGELYAGSYFGDSMIDSSKAVGRAKITFTAIEGQFDA